MTKTRRHSGPVTTDTPPEAPVTQTDNLQPELDMVERDGPEPGPELDALVIALLLVSPTPATVDQLARGAGVDPADIEVSLGQLTEPSSNGWVVQRHGDVIQLGTAPRFARFVRRFLGLDREARLSAASLETLAIVAYQQPVTRAEIEAIRGVDCSGVLATLHGRGLIEDVGRIAGPGNPFQYGSTADFLRHFGLSSLDDLPPIGSVEGRDGLQTLQAAIATAESPE